MTGTLHIRIDFVYQTKQGLEKTLRSDEMTIGEAVIIAEDLERTGRAKQLTFTDTYESTWTIKELKKYLEEIQTEPHHIKVYFDGGYDLKTGKAGLGCVIYYEQNNTSYRLRKNAAIEEIMNNNEAEYAALYYSLQELELLGVHHLSVTFTGDSMVVINQLNGEWPCYEEELTKWIDRIEKKMERLGITPDYQTVSRKRNREADQLATQALNGIEISSRTER